MRSTFLWRARVALLLSLILPAPALAQSLVGGTVLNGTVPVYNVNGTAPLTIDQATLGLRVTCVSGCTGGGGSGSGGTVTQGAAATDTVANRWPVLAYQGGSWTTADGVDGTGTNPGTGARGWLSGIYARLGGTLNVVIGAGSSTIGAVTQAGTWAVNSTLQAGSAIIGRVGIDQTTDGTTNKVFVGNNTNPATATNQAAEITALNAIAGRMVTFTDLSNASVAAASTTKGAVHDAGSAYTLASVAAYATQAGSVAIYACPDSACSQFFLIQSAALTAGGNSYATVRLPTRWWQIWVNNTNATTAGTAFAYSSQTAN